jgi:glutamate racemase
MLPSNPIGVFDSGVGGLSVLRAIRQELPAESILYLADQGHVPYGPRPLEEVRSFAEGITRFLLDRGSKLIVVACNAASAAALHTLRQQFPQVTFVGMEPAVKPAAEYTRTGRVGVLATPATFQGLLYASVVERFAQGVILYQDTCPGLVAQIEAGELDTPLTRAILKKALQPMLDQGIDTVVLGCTHYPFVIPLIQSIAGPHIRVIDPAPAIARQARRMLDMRHLTRPCFPLSPDSDQYERGEMQFFTSGPPIQLQALLSDLLCEIGPVYQVVWGNGELVLNNGG